MHWILWTLLLFQGLPSDQSDANVRSLQSIQRDEFARETSIDAARSKGQKSATEAARRALAAAQEKQFLDRYNRLMKAMMQFAESYNNRHTVDAKLLQAVKHAFQDLQKHDALFRDAGKE
jgi:RecJ-like exonuclease